jgi:hypothetical protein
LLNRNVATAAGFGGKPPQKPALEISNIWLNPSGGNLIAKVSVAIPRWGETMHSSSVARTAPENTSSTLRQHRWSGVTAWRSEMTPAR